MDPTHKAIEIHGLSWMRGVDQALWNPVKSKRKKRGAIVGGRRTGKTTHSRSTILRMFSEAEGTGGEIWFGTETLHHAKMIQWDKLNHWIKQLPMSFLDGKPNKTDLTIPLKYQRTIRLVGMDTTDERLRGVELLGFIGDEWDRVKRPEKFTTEIEPSLGDRNAPAVFYSSPKGKRTMYRMWQYGQPGPYQDPDWVSVCLDQEQVGTLSPEVLRRMKREMTPDEYNQEVKAIFLDYSGTLFPEFNNRLSPEGHILPEAEEPKHINLKEGHRFCTMDQGYTDETAMLWWWVSPEGRVYLYDYFGAENCSPENFMLRMRKTEDPYGSQREPNQDIWGDPAMWQADKGSGISPAARFRNAGWKGLRSSPHRLFWDRLLMARKMMEYPEDSEFPGFMIVEHRMPKLASKLAMAVDDWLNPGRQGFRSGIDVHVLDALLYGVMIARPHMPAEGVTAARGYGDPTKFAHFPEASVEDEGDVNGGLDGF